LKTKPFQLRWNEPLGKKECPYARRFVLLVFDFGLRLHIWKRSDDKRYFHNHPWGFITIVLWGRYTDVSKNPETGKTTIDKLSFLSIRYRPASHLHYVDVPESGAVTLVLSGRPLTNWGFWVNNKIMRPLRFFSRYGHPACNEQ